MFARDLHYIDDHRAALDDAARLDGIRERIMEGDVFVARRVFPEDLLERIKGYLAGIGRSSLPNYRRIEMGCPNHHRINFWDERSHVKACFHQFSFFPWNQDVFNFFALARDVYYMKNLLSRNPKERFLQRVPEAGCVTRLSFQFYPKGLGGMNKHQDPTDHHQTTALAMTMSKKGKDFLSGGAYVETVAGKKLYLDEVSDPGDVVCYNARTPHGVEKIDPQCAPDWTSFEGRWVLLFCINKLGSNDAIADSVDLESPRAVP